MPPAQLEAPLVHGDDVGPLVPVHVGHDDGGAQDPVLLQRVLLPGRRGISGILVPGDLPLLAEPGGHHVQVAVPVQVVGHTLEAVPETFLDVVHAPVAGPPGSVGVLIPDQVVLVGSLSPQQAARHHQVQVSVPVHIGGGPMHGTVAEADDVPPPGTGGRIPAVLVPEHHAGHPGRSHQVDEPVPVEVSRPDHPGLEPAFVHDVGGPLFVLPRTGIPIPGELVPEPPTGGGHVRTAIPVQIGHVHVVGPHEAAARDGVLLPGIGLRRIARVLEPEDVPVEVVDPHQVDSPVLIDVRQAVPFVTALPVLLGHEMALEVSGPVVLEPVEGIVDARPLGPAVGTREIQVAVAVQVGGRHGVGVGVVVGDEMFLELQVPGLESQARGGESEKNSTGTPISGPVHGASRCLSATSDFPPDR